MHQKIVVVVALAGLEQALDCLLLPELITQLLLVVVGLALRYRAITA